MLLVHCSQLLREFYTRCALNTKHAAVVPDYTEPDDPSTRDSTASGLHTLAVNIAIHTLNTNSHVLVTSGCESAHFKFNSAHSIRRSRLSCAFVHTVKSGKQFWWLFNSALICRDIPRAL